MGVLTSQLFTEADPATIKKLEDCATSQPNEMVSHFMKGHGNGHGEHIIRVQQALKNVQGARPEFGIPEFEVNGIYDERFARAIFVYKEKKGIRNYANQIDDIVGVKTIRSLDSDNAGRPVVPPTPMPKKPSVVPRPLPNCVPDGDCPASREFDVTMLFGASGGEILELSKYWFTIRDTTNGLSSLYLFEGAGLGVPTPVPASVADGGAATHFMTGDPVRVTRFGPSAGLAGVTPYVEISGPTMLTMQYQPENEASPLRSIPLIIDTGVITIPGAGCQGAKFSVLSTCGGGAGAVRRVITRADLVFG